MNTTPTDEPRPGIFVRHPWIFVCFAFALLCGAWSALIFVAVKQAPQTVETSSAK